MSRSIEKLCSEVTSTLSHLLGDTLLTSGEMTAQLMSLLHQMALQTGQREKLSSLTEDYESVMQKLADQSDANKSLTEEYKQVMLSV